MRKKLSLNGLWNWKTPGKQAVKKNVPSSYLCVGDAWFQKDFTCPDLTNEESVILCFDGIAYEGAVSVNDAKVGSMLPYVPYQFDITAALRQGQNNLNVHIKDITAIYGPTEGWESYGGIIRDVYLLIVNTAHIEDYRWQSDFSDKFQKANCHLQLTMRNESEMEFSRRLAITLGHEGEPIHTFENEVHLQPGANEVTFHIEVDHPLLWSPQFPHLYDLDIQLFNHEQLIDEVGQKVGFREFIAKGSRFYLNGQDTVLKGVCRHDMWGEQGLTLTVEQMEQDMLMIKQMGANYIRLVHYPHHKKIIEIADRIGLMVSEEPGLWQSDLNNDSIIDCSVEVMRRTIMRDKNHASVVFWLAFNECWFTDKFMSKMVRMCRETDATRLISGANYMSPASTKEMFDRHSVDFYTYHPYGHYPNLVQAGPDADKPYITIEEALGILAEKPVLFTEWGGWWIRDNPGLLHNFGQSLIQYARNRSPDPSLAGFAYWQYNDIFQTSRGFPGCEQAILTEGLVDIYRNKKDIYYGMSDIFAELDTPPKKKETGIKMERLRFPHVNGVAIDLSGVINDSRQESMWKGVWNEKRKKQINGPRIPHDIVEIDRLPVNIGAGRPLTLNHGCRQVDIPIGLNVSRLVFFGHVTCFDGFPTKGNYGDVIARYVFIYSDGSSKETVLKNGIDFTTASLISGPSRINPTASQAERIMTVNMDTDFEVYQVNVSLFDADPGKTLETVKFELIDDSYMPLLFGITAIQ